MWEIGLGAGVVHERVRGKGRRAQGRVYHTPPTPLILSTLLTHQHTNDNPPHRLLPSTQIRPGVTCTVNSSLSTEARTGVYRSLSSDCAWEDEERVVWGGVMDNFCKLTLVPGQ